MAMTKKLRKKIKRISISVLVIVTILLASFALLKYTNSSLFVIQKDTSDKSSLDYTEAVTRETSDLGTVNETEDRVIICDSIVQGVKQNNLPDGNYIFRVVGNTGGENETKDYAVEIVNYYDDVTYSLDEGQTSKTISLGDTTAEYKMLVAKYHKNLNIDSGVTVTANTYSNGLTYKKGMYICVIGNLTNNGKISMTARGTYGAEGENLYLWKNNDNSFEYVPKNGAVGVPAKSPYYSGGNGVKGNNGTNRATGSGGQGASIINTNNNAHSSYIGASTAGSTYSGGNGTGGMVRCNYSALSASYTAASALQGGNGSAYDAGTNTYYFAGGGAGVQGGSSSYCRLGTGSTQTKAENGTGGLLILYANSILNDGKIESNGSARCRSMGKFTWKL